MNSHLSQDREALPLVTCVRIEVQESGQFRGSTFGPHGRHHNENIPFRVSRRRAVGNIQLGMIERTLLKSDPVVGETL